MLKQTTAVTCFLICLLILVYAAAHENHGGVRAGDFLVALEPAEAEAGKQTTIYVLIDYAANETGVGGLKVTVEIKDIAAGTSAYYYAEDVGKGIYRFEATFERPGLKNAIIVFENTTAIIPFNVREANNLSTVLSRVAPYAVIVGILAGMVFAFRKKGNKQRF